MSALALACGGGNNTNNQPAGRQAMPSPDTTPATSTAGGDVNTAPSDAQIFAVLSEANEAEIDAAKTALDKAKHADVKAFARQMIADHTKLLHGGKALADSLHVAPQPPANDSLATHVSQEKQQLSSVSAPTFDKTYMDAQVQDHETVLALLKQYEGQAQNPRLKGMITKAEPIVQRHLTHAQAVDAKLAAPAA
ncbi:MAG TPA: DUF4142 domain-containing protein [Gemmatimonadaceae bacterium]|nr:DUF4142 domain-containing protein [Gemmatimonadaceae bacterium]